MLGQFRPKKLIDSIKAEISSVDEWELSTLKDVAKHFLDKSLYSLGMCSQLSLLPSTSVLLGTEQLGEKERRRHKLMLFHKACFSDYLSYFTPSYFIRNVILLGFVFRVCSRYKVHNVQL